MLVRFPAILIVDGDEVLARTLRLNLEKDGFDAVEARDGRAALAALQVRKPDVMVVDFSLQDMPGFELSRRVKQALDIPIIMLTGPRARGVGVEGSECYVEDYVAKPLYYRVLLARINRVLKRGWRSAPPPAAWPGAEASIDFARHAVIGDGRAEHLTPTEARLLAILARNANRAIAADSLIDQVWPDCDGDAPRLWVNIQRIRQKLEPEPRAPRYLVTVPNEGYKLVVG